MKKEVEYRVRAVIRYSLTRWYHESDGKGGEGGGCATIGEFDNITNADAVGRALHAQEPGSTFATIEDRREPLCTVTAYTPEQSSKLMEFAAQE